MYVKAYGDGTTVTVGAHIVSAKRADGSLITNSNVDYYYEERGYGCRSEEEVADQYYENFCNRPT